MFYLLIGGLMLPWVAYVLGAALRLYFRGGRAHWGQLLSALVLLSGSVMLWAFYDPNFGIDPWHTKDWTHTAERIEGWLFPIAFVFLIVFMLPGLKHEKSPPLWRKIGTALTLAFILCGAGAAWYVSRNVALPWLDLPWSVARAVFTASAIPHALGYLLASALVRINAGKTEAPQPTQNETEA